ncbi:hypothetical protein, partial [Enterobacter hormaechei]|uniref:hypothetical protein n=1 Tax=Enterobacter hormaechei TaxID=158836 RepID=UPI001E58E691
PSMTVLTAGSVSDKICRYASSIMAPACRGDAGAMMLDAYRQILSETEPAVRTVMLEFLESVRIHYISS